MTAETLRTAALDAPIGEFRAELIVAERAAEEERLRSYGSGRERILELERMLRDTRNALNLEVLKSSRAALKLETIHAQLQGVFDQDFRDMSRVKFGFEISEPLRQLGTLADRIDEASTPDDLARLKRIVKNFGIKRPAGFIGQALQVGLVFAQ